MTSDRLAAIRAVALACNSSRRIQLDDWGCDVGEYYLIPQGAWEELVRLVAEGTEPE